jgi:hypothetical protein
METTTCSLTNEITNLSGTLSVLTAVLDKTSARFNELQAMIEHEKNELLKSKVGGYAN